MKITLINIVVFLTLISWKADIKGPWITNEGKRIILHTRPIGFSKAKSPDSLTIQKIIKEQEQAIDFINRRIKTHFNSKVDIFLYNLDEAKEKIGTNGGGFTNLNRSKSHIYFTYQGTSTFNSIKNTYEFMGDHEMVHVITIHELGGLTTSFFGEGYANALAGNYGSELINNRLTWRRNDSTLVKLMKSRKLVKPSELLYNKNIPVREFYPQVGCLVNWLFNTYGVEKINELYCVKRDKIEKEFFKVTCENFATMEKRYMEYCQNIK